MDAAATAAPLSTSDTHPTWQLWVGRVLSALPVLMMLMSAGMKFAQQPKMVEMFQSKFGYGAGLLVPLGIVELSVVVIYAIPRTAVLGAILMTGYLGGAVATHVRVSDMFVIPLVLGICAWGGLYFRDQRVRDLLPLRKSA